jgi:raffinose/stachyose/melibiose transport system permease protein
MKNVGYYKVKSVSVTALFHLFLIAVAVSCVFPLIWMVMASLKTQTTIFDGAFIPKQFHFENYYHAMRQGNFGRYFVNSIFYTVSVVGSIVIISSLAAYAFSRFRFAGKNMMFYMFIIAMMIPIPGSFVAQYVLLNTLHLRNTALGYILCMISVGLSTSIFLLKTFYDTMPHELEDAARIDGCSKLGTWWHVALPLSTPVLAVVIIFNTLNVWNEYILALITFDSKNLMPLQVALQSFRGEFVTNYPLLMAALTITVLPVIALYMVMQKYMVKAVTQGVVAG